MLYVTDMWRCKEHSASFSGRYDLLKNLRLQHNNRQHYSCTLLNCPCSFKTLNALHIHLSRVHPKQTCQEVLELKTVVHRAIVAIFLQGGIFSYILAFVLRIMKLSLVCLGIVLSKQISMELFTPTRTGNTTPIH